MLILDAESDSNRTIWVTWVLVVLNIVGFVLQVVVGDPITYGYSLVPASGLLGAYLFLNPLPWGNFPDRHENQGRPEPAGTARAGVRQIVLPLP